MLLPAVTPEKKDMDYCFENVGMPERRALVEMQYRIAAKITWILAAVYLLLGFWFLEDYLWGEGFLLMPVIFFVGAVYFVLLPYIQVRRRWKQNLQFHNGTLPVNTIQFGEKIRVENETASRTWEYQHLKKVYSLKYSYCLLFADKTALYMNRANFTKGSFEEFKQFLREKRPDLKIPD